MAKTNQLMNVKIVEGLTIKVHNKSLMGRVDDILSFGNQLRVDRGLSKIALDSIFKKQDFWEFVIARNTQKVSECQNDDYPPLDIPKCKNDGSPIWVKSDYSRLEEFKTKHSKMNYSDLMKMFPSVISSIRGGKVENRGHYMDIYIILKIATILDKDLEVAIYHKVLSDKILTHRENGSDSFLSLNQMIDRLEDRSIELKPKGNKGCYITIAKMIRKKLDIITTKGYNEEEHNNYVQIKRDEIEKQLISFIDMGFVTTYPQLKIALSKITITN